jgi:hypothetical protein
MVAYQKLMKGLEKHEPNVKKRSEHIITNMLYMVELNPKNVKISKKIFGPAANICCADFLEETDKWFKSFKVEKFNIIMGNPPFNAEKITGTGERVRGKQILWDEFIKKSLDIIEPKGLLCFITPPPWRKPEHKLYSLMTQDNQLLYLHIIGKARGKNLFDVVQRFDLYIIEKTPKYKNTEIIDELDHKIELDLSKWPFIPNYEYDNIKRILTTAESGIDVIYDTFYHAQKEQGKTKHTEHMTQKDKETYKYPVVHQNGVNGLTCIYTDDDTKGHFRVSKVLLSANEQQYPVNDYAGKYGMSEITFGIPITSEKQGDDIVKAINTDEFK